MDRFQAGSARDIVKDGTWFRDTQSRYVLFRGVNFGSRSKRPPYLPLLPLHITQLDTEGVNQFRLELQKVQGSFDTMKRLGVNLVRLLVMWKAIEPRPNPHLEELLPEGRCYLELVTELIDSLYSRGMFVFIDFHQDIAHEVYGGDGFPDWALAIDEEHERPSPPSTLEDTKWGLHYYDTFLTKWDVLVRHTLRSFWRNQLRNIELNEEDSTIAQPVRTHLEKTIGATARYFQALNGGQGHPGILGYEPFNEPHQVGIPKAEFEGQILPEYYANVLWEIRRAASNGAAGDTRAFLFIEPRVDWTVYPIEVQDFGGMNFTLSPQSLLDTSVFTSERAIFSFHYYDPWALFYGGLGHGDNMHNKQREWPNVFLLMREAAVARGLIPVLTEFGGSHDWQFSTDLRPTVYRTQIRAYMDLQYKQVEDKLLNATYWNYDLYNTETEKDNWNLENFSLLGPGRTPRHQDIVARPYPLRSSAQPQLLSFDCETKHCAIILQGPVVNAPTVIYIPEIQYPNGFEVRASSGQFMWDYPQQVLQWFPDANQPLHQIIICPPDTFNRDALPVAFRELLSLTPFRKTFLFRPAPLQHDWRWCHKCGSLFWAGGGATAGICPAGGAHTRGASSDYALVMEVADTPGQHDWRWCHKCGGLFWAGGGAAAGICPAGGTHTRGASSDYALVMDVPVAPGQHDWRWCHKCGSLFWAGGGATAGICPAGGAHTRGASSDYALVMQ